MASEQSNGIPPDAKTVVVVPTFNEADNLPTLVAELHALGIPGLSVLVVDDNSPDGTGRVADMLVGRFPDVLAVRHRPEKQGLGRAYVDGFGIALASGADFVVQMDADFSHAPGTIHTMLAEIRACDVVVGSRYISGGRVDERWGWWRQFLSWWANDVWARQILNLKTRDITSGFKCWRRQALLGIRLDCVQSNGYAFQVEMAYLAERLGYRIKEIPIYFEDRRIGRSKMSVPVKLEGAWDVIRIWLRYR